MTVITANEEIVAVRRKKKTNRSCGRKYYLLDHEWDRFLSNNITLCYFALVMYTICLMLIANRARNIITASRKLYYLAKHVYDNILVNV